MDKNVHSDDNTEWFSGKNFLMIILGLSDSTRAISNFLNLIIHEPFQNNCFIDLEFEFIENIAAPVDMDENKINKVFVLKTQEKHKWKRTQKRHINSHNKKNKF